MEQPDYLLEAGTKIKTHETLGQTKGFLIRQDYLDNRKPNTEGTIRGIVGGHGGDVYWVENEDHSIAAYMFTEFELVDA